MNGAAYRRAYDANGNTLSDASGRTFTWDYDNRLTQAVVPGTSGGTTTFKYDPFGRRIQKSGTLGTTNYLYDGLRAIEDADGSGNILARYTAGGGVDEPLAELLSTTASYYEQDASGSVTSLSNPTGGMGNTYTFNSFGRLTASTGTNSNRFQYTGREFDHETGIDYYRARYYDPAIGRFLGEDPIQFVGGIDFYRYALNSPLDFADPSGLCPPENDLVPANPCQYAGRALTPADYAAEGAAANESNYSWFNSLFSLWGGTGVENFYLNITGFPRGNYLDPQPLGSGNPVQNAAYGNYVYGVYMQAAGVPLWFALSGANAYAYVSGAQYGPNMGANGFHLRIASRRQCYEYHERI